MGEVWRARDGRLGREVAIKTLPEALASDTDARARFTREARAIAALSHPNVLAIFDVALAPDTPEVAISAAIQEHYFGWDFAREERELKAARDAAPRLAAPYYWVRHDPGLAPLREDPRFPALAAGVTPAQ